MAQQTIRPYEISLWGLQDNFIKKLAAPFSSHRGQIIDPVLDEKDDGTQSFKFSVPMKVDNKDNPLWFDFQEGILLQGQRKIKVGIFKKGSDSPTKIYEFLITEIDERHQKGELICDVTCEGLAFHELGKIGYKINLSQELFELDYENIINQPVYSVKGPYNTYSTTENKMCEIFIDELKVGSLYGRYKDKYSFKWYEKTPGQTDWSAMPSETKSNLQVPALKTKKWYLCKIYFEGKQVGQTDPCVVAYSNKEDSNYQKPTNFFYSYEPIANLNYWADKIFKDTNWTYRVEMNWANFDGIFSSDQRATNPLLRKSDKIYEEDFISAWENVQGEIVPAQVESYREKARIISVEKSNCYNATQTLAETFGVFCRYDYEHDERGHITNRICIFYNDYFKENKSPLDITYPFNTDDIVRSIDSSEITTKMYVAPFEDESTYSGLLSIIDASGNKTGEDYIYNFDYLYDIGAISEEQKNDWRTHEKELFILNSQLKPLSKEIHKIENEINDIKANLVLLQNSQKGAEEQMNKARQAKESILNGATEFSTANNPDLGVLVKDADGNNRVNISQEGVLSTSSIVYYKSYDDYKSDIDRREVSEKDLIKDSLSNCVIGFYVPSDMANFIKCYLIYSYKPTLKYDNIYETFAKRYAEDTQRIELNNNLLNEQTEALNNKKKEYQKLLNKKTFEIVRFEKKMGAAIKEAPWQAEDYTDFGQKKRESFIKSTPGVKEDLKYFWDDQIFENELLDYYEEGVNLEKKYFPRIEVNEAIFEKIKNDLDNIVLSFNTLPEESSKTIYYSIHSQLEYSFCEENGGLKVYILILDKTFSYDTNITYELGLVNSTIGIDNIPKISFKPFPVQINITDNYTPEEEKQVYPRLAFLSPLTKTGYENIAIYENQNILKKYYDYSLLFREGLQYITFKPSVFLRLSEFNIEYFLSTGAQSLYLDALEVSKNNAMPKVSYKTSIRYFNKKLLENLELTLGRLIQINDSDLKLKQVRGYISELSLRLDKPWEDSFTIKNYKTSFEDLFSKLTVSAEQIKTNGYLYNNAANAFTSSGSLRPENLQESFNNTNLDLFFQKGNLNISEINGLVGSSEDGVVAFRKDGIFCANERDENNNWKWNTGITPNGIDASLIKSGQINTNTIKIFAGNNTRFQLNSEGLFAYRQVDGITDPNWFVVNNSDGLFLKRKFNENDPFVNLVEVSWEGFKIRNSEGTEVFKADDNGNLTITGAITATALTIRSSDGSDSNIDKYISDNNSVQKSVASTVSLYAVNQSKTEAPPTAEENWSTDFPLLKEDEFLWERTKTTLMSGTVSWTDPICLSSTGKDAAVLRIDSSNGNVFKNTEVNTTLTAIIYYGNTQIKDIKSLEAIFGKTVSLQWWVLKKDTTDYVRIQNDKDPFNLELKPGDVDSKATYKCNLVVG